MKKPIIILTALAAMNFAAEARTLTPAEALGRIARTTLSAPSLKPVATPQPVYTELEAESLRPMAYVFAATGGGYMILSADDVAVPVLAYSDESDFDAGNMPDNMREWLRGYAAEIAAASTTIVMPGNAPTATAPEREAIAPMLTTRWNQNEPYNDLCPVAPGYSSPCPTGCVATAMAQVMKYHNWPQVGRSSISYTSRDLELDIDCDFTAYPFDWDNMLDDYDPATSTAEQRKAVATLMKVVGASVEMNYNAVASGSRSERVGDALVKYFDYDQSTIVRDRNHYSTPQWEEMVYGELAEGRPLYYAGANSTGAHAFVCDGYSADGFYHFNWGWGGMSDGYFRLSALDPASQGIGGSTAGFSYMQYAAFGVQPPVEGSKPRYEMSRGMLSFSLDKATKGSVVTMNSGIYNRSHRTIPGSFGLTIAARFHNLDTDANLYFVTGISNYASDLNDNIGWKEVSFKLGSAMADGNYEVTMVFRGAGGEWQEVVSRSPNFNNRMFAVASGTTVTFTSRMPEVNATDVTPGAVYRGRRFNVGFNLVNNDDKPFYSGICAAFIDNSGEIKAAGSVMTVDVDPHSTTPIDYTTDFYAMAEDFTPGDYKLVVVDYNAYTYGQQLYYSDPVDVTVKEVPAEPLRLTLSSWTVLNPTKICADDIHVKFSVKCLTGVYAAPLVVAFYEKNADGTTGTYLGMRECEYTVIEKGESLVKEYAVAFSSLEVGKSYILSPCYYDDDMRLMLFGNSNRTITVSALTDLETVESDAAVCRRYFDLSGREVKTPSRGSVVIERSVDAAGNITTTKHIF